MEAKVENRNGRKQKYGKDRMRLRGIKSSGGRQEVDKSQGVGNSRSSPSILLSVLPLLGHCSCAKLLSGEHLRFLINMINWLFSTLSLTPIEMHHLSIDDRYL